MSENEENRLVFDRLRRVPSSPLESFTNFFSTFYELPVIFKYTSTDSITIQGGTKIRLDRSPNARTFDVRYATKYMLPFDKNKHTITFVQRTRRCQSGLLATTKTNVSKPVTSAGPIFPVAGKRWEKRKDELNDGRSRGKMRNPNYIKVRPTSWKQPVHLTCTCLVSSDTLLNALT